MVTSDKQQQQTMKVGLQKIQQQTRLGSIM